jgi:hypothetical protein
MQGGFSLALFYFLLGEASKNLQTFLELSTTFQELFLYYYPTRSMYLFVEKINLSFRSSFPYIQQLTRTTDKQEGMAS